MTMDRNGHMHADGGKHAPSVSPAADRAVAEVIALRATIERMGEEQDAFILKQNALRAENARLTASNKELARLCEKALTRSAIVHPGFSDEIRAALGAKQ